MTFCRCFSFLGPKLAPMSSFCLLRSKKCLRSSRVRLKFSISFFLNLLSSLLWMFVDLCSPKALSAMDLDRRLMISLPMPSGGKRFLVGYKSKLRWRCSATSRACDVRAASMFPRSSSGSRFESEAPSPGARAAEPFLAPKATSPLKLSLLYADSSGRPLSRTILSSSMASSTEEREGGCEGPDAGAEGRAFDEAKSSSSMAADPSLMVLCLLYFLRTCTSAVVDLAVCRGASDSLSS
mmetsp:Transcript_27810/g.55595  ORF Transcript_27810/g.55595 Transcript_27810/m.55595 type:complete len:238 (+) Transcript_27810:171-884(+)